MTRTAWAILVLLLPSLAFAGTVEIDFETPKLIGIDWLAADSYLDPSSGVVFVGDRVIGPVVNAETSACVEPANRDQKLGTGLQDQVGRAADTIYVYFPQPLLPPVSISFELQSALNTSWRIDLFHPVGETAGSGTGYLSINGGTCGYPGGPRSRGTVLATSDVPVGWAVIGAADMEMTNFVFVIDNMIIESPSVGVGVNTEATTWSAMKASFGQ